MHSIREYRNWAVLLLVVFAATTVAVGAPAQSPFALNSSVLAPNGTTAPRTVTSTGPARPHAIQKTAKPVPQTDAKSVLLIWADTDNPATLIAGLEAYGHTVTSYEGYYQPTPDVSYLQQFGAVVVWSNYPFNNSVQMGNNLADYVDGGGRVIVGMFSYINWSGYYLQGRLAEETPYQALEYNVGYSFGTFTTDWLDPSHPITAGLTAMSDGYEGYVHAVSTATLLGTQDGGYDFCALSQNEEVVAINLYPGEYGMATGPWIQLIHQAIEFSAGPPLDTDVGVMSILAPAAIQAPGSAVTPTIRIKNFGGLPQSNIPVGIRIWDPNANLVYDQTQTYAGPLAAGDTVSIASFPVWTVGNEISYRCSTFTALPGDEKTRNDTAKLTIATIGWQDIPPPTSDLDRLVHGTMYDPDNDMLYMVGGDVAGGGTYLTRLQSYDPTGMVWTDLASMPTAKGWIQGEYVNGKLYVLAGLNTSFMPITTSECYDIASNTWTTVAAAPRATACYLMDTYDGRLIYMMGGLNASASGGTNNVDIYDPATNSWSVGTPLPHLGDMGSAAIIGDTIYIAQALDRSTSSCWSNLVKGAINPADPTQITWIEGPALADPIFNGGTAALDEYVYWMGGFINTSTVTGKLYRYNTETGVIENFAIADYPKTIARNNYLVARAAGSSPELYCFAGDLAGNWSTPNNEYRKLAFPAKNNDVGVLTITEPTDAEIDAGTDVDPACFIKNFGQLAQTAIDVQCIITDAAGFELVNDTLQVATLASGESTEVVFPTFGIPDSLFIGRTFAFRTLLVGDQRPNNDAKSLRTMTLSDEVYSYAGMPAPEIDGYMSPGEWDDAFSFDCSNIFGWSGVPQGPGAAYAYFKNDAGYLYVAVKMPEAPTRDIGDKVGLLIDENNDGAWASGLSEGEYRIWFNNSSADEVQFRYHAPNGAVGQWSTVVGSSSVSNADNGLVFEARIPIGSTPSKITLNDPTNDTVGLYLIGLDGAKYYGWFPGALDLDDANDPSAYGSLVFMSLQSGDVGVNAIVTPAGNYQPETPITPVATWKNFGTTPMNLTGYLFITDPSGARVFTGSQATSLNAGQSVNLTFTPAYTLVDTGVWAVKCSTVSVGDNNAANDIRSATFTVRPFVANPGWHAKSAMPGALPKDGGAMAYSADEGLIYEMKGNKTLEFNSYNPVDTMWTTLAPIPAGLKPVKGGASMATGAGKVFITKGNNTLEFYRYSIADSTWMPATKTVPLGAGKKVKAGGSMAFVTKPEGDFVYLLKGYGTEFYRYDVTNDSFTPLANAPDGIKPKYDKGSWIAYDGEQWLYVMKSKYGVDGSEFYKYDVQAEAWSTAVMPTIMLVDPLMGKKKKLGDGSCAAFGGDALYALKGNNNNTFWKYTPDDSLGTWAELETVPQVAQTGDKKKKVKAGAALAYVPDMGAFYAQKGNKVNQFWQYVPNNTVMAGERAMRDGVAAGSVTKVALSMTVSPSPLVTGYATLRYSLPKSGVAMMNVYDVTGRSVITRTLNTGRTGSTALDLRNLSAGVYLVKLSSDGFSTSQKLVVER